MNEMSSPEATASHLEVLPPLPAMSAHKIEVFGYSAEQMQEYARAAMAAMLAAAPSPHQPAEPQSATTNFNEIGSKLVDAEPQQDGEDQFVLDPVAPYWAERARWEARGYVVEEPNTTPQPAARRVTEGAVLGHLPAPIRNPEAWPPNYADGWNDCARTAADGVCESFAASRGEAAKPRCGDVRHELDAYIWRRESTQEWVMEISGTINDCNFTVRHQQPLTVPPEEVASLPTLYASRGEAVATLHSDGYWTHPAGKDPFDRYGPRANTTKLDVFTTPTPDARVRELVEAVRELDAKGNNRTNKRVRAALAAMDQERE